MKILYVITDAAVGGAERFLLTLLTNKHAGDTVGLVVLMARDALSAALDDASDWVRYLEVAPNQRRVDRMVRALNEAIREFEPDVISSHLFHADLITALATTVAPKTTTVHTQGFGKWDHPLTKVIARAVGLLSWRFAAVIPSSDSSEMSGFIRAMHYTHVFPAIPNAADLPASPQWAVNSRRVVSLARSHPVKGHAILFKAADGFLRKNPAWGLDCYGAGVVAEDPLIANAIRTAGVSDLLDQGRIRLLGPTAEPNAVLSQAAVLVISSGYGEAFPIVGVEAAGLGVPVITTDVGSSREFADTAAQVVAPGDARALGQALIAYAALGDVERTQLSQAARIRAERRYAPERAIEAYRAVFSSVISER
jgi:glycosyltransferase involved in cell wall biosynthesis